MQTGAATVENGIETPQKIKTGAALWYSVFTSGNIFKETWSTNSKEYTNLYVHWSIIYSSQDLKAAQVPISRWVDKMTMGHLHNEILLTGKKEEAPTFCNSVDGPGKYYAKWNKPVIKRQVPYDFT